MTLGIADVAALVALLRSPAARDHDGEPVNIVEHGLQCAALLRARAPRDTELQVAGLVHDIGTVVSPNLPATHAATGADAVRPLLGDRVAALVAGHDLAKRYLVSTDTAYRSRLTPRSIETFEEQGGELDQAGRTELERSPNFSALVELRRADDDAKVPDLDVSTVEDWRAALEQVARDGSSVGTPR